MKTTRLFVISLVFLIGLATVFFSSPSTAASAPEFLGITLTPTSTWQASPTPVAPTPTLSPSITPSPTATADPGEPEEDDDPLDEIVFLPPAGFGVETQVDQPEMPAGILGEPARLIIPGLRVNSPVLGVTASGHTWDIRGLGSSIGWLAETARPSEPGNVVLVGHVYVENEAPFKYLNLLEPGQEVRLVMGSTLYVYRVTGSRLADPQDTSVLRSDGRHMLTLITCSQYDSEHKVYLKRLIVTAELVNRVGQTVTAE